MEDDTAVETPAPTVVAPLWVGLVTWAALALVAIVAVTIIGIVGQAAALGDIGAQAKALNFSDRLGYSFHQNLDQAPLGLALLFAVCLALTPAMARRPSTTRQDNLAQLVLVGAVALGLLLAIGGVLVVPARVDIIHQGNGKVTGYVDWVLFTYVVRHVGIALVAMGAALAGVRVRFTPRRSIPDTPAP